MKTPLEFADEILGDKEPYALKIAKELRQAVGDRVLLDQAAQCLEDDCDYLKKIAESIKNNAVVNAAKLREALEFIAHYDDDEAQMDDPYCADGHILADKAKEALGIKEKEGGAK